MRSAADIDADCEFSNANCIFAFAAIEGAFIVGLCIGAGDTSSFATSNDANINSIWDADNGLRFLFSAAIPDTWRRRRISKKYACISCSPFRSDACDKIIELCRFDETGWIVADR